MLEALERCAARWGVDLEAPLNGATCSLVWRGRHGTYGDVVLKTPDPDRCDFRAAQSAMALADFGGVTILGHDPESGSTLMPCLDPGTHLAESGLSDDEAVLVVAKLLARIHQAPRYDAITLEDRMRELWLAESASPMFHRAAEVSKKLLATSPAPVLLHGDLHHFNVLRHRDNWLAIDPESLCGDPAYDISAFMRNPLGSLEKGPALKARSQRRLEGFARSTGHAIERLWGWSFAQTALAALWAKDDPSTHEEWTRVAQCLDDLRHDMGQAIS